MSTHSPSWNPVFIERHQQKMAFNRTTGRSVNVNVNVEETSSHYINIEETSSHNINIEETSSHYINKEETSTHYKKRRN